MNMIEDQLRDAYRAAAETVEPGSIRPLGDHISAISETGRSARRPGRWPGRLMIPMAAAAAVAAIAILTTLIIPRVILGARSHGRSPATPVSKFAVAMAGMPGVYSEGAKTLTIFNATSGTTVATVASPRRHMYFAGVASGEAGHFVAELRRPGVCRTWLYQFRLGPRDSQDRLPRTRFGAFAIW